MISLKGLLTFLSGDVGKEWRSIVAEHKEMKSDWRTETLELRATVKEQSDEIYKMKIRIGELEEMEKRCLEGQVIIMQQVTNIREKMIFKTRGRHEDDEII